MSGGVGRALCGALVGALLWSAACAGGRGRPDWIDGSAAAYPRERYLIGVGEGESLDAARDRARAEIARIFDVHIEDAVVDRSEEVAVMEGARRRSSIVERIAVETRTSTRAELEGVEIAETWQDSASQRVYALAVLDARRAHRRLLEQAAARDADVVDLVADAEGAGGALGEVRARVAAARASRERDALLVRARVVGPVDRATLEGAPGTAALERGLEAALARTGFELRARETGAPGAGDLPGLRDALAARLTRMGFRAADPALAPAALRVHCRLALQRVERGGAGWWHYRWEGACDVADASGVAISAADAGSESHPVDATALAKARARAEQALAEAVERELQRYLYGEE
jgi:hypothetical protein